MNKGELVAMVANHCDTSKNEVTKVIDALLECITKTVASGENVRLVGFGSFSSIKRAPRVGRNPQTGKTIAIPARKTVKFTAGNKLNSALR
ncbi:MAG: hypothetical protein CSA34_01675 [Desulfobulbus propionicus]|nr:MAG: hypothetical protein CSA34_01675 [Desulfobulbus propionicus]